MPYLMTNRRGLGVYYRPRRTSPRRRLRGLGYLGQASALTPQQAFQQAIQQTGYGPLNPRDFQNPAYLSKVAAQIQAGQFDIGWVSPSCAGIFADNPAVKDLSLTQAVGGIAGATTGALAATLTPSASAIAAGASTAASVALGAATLGIGMVVAVLSIIFAHHAAAVRQEQQLECTGTQAANNAMNVIAEGVASGQIKPADAVTALNSIYSQYQKIVAPSFGTSPWCNANCELEIVMLGMVLYWQAQYQAMADQQAAAAAASAATAAGVTAPVTNAVSSVAASTGLPSWAIYLLGGLLVYQLVS